MKSAIFLVLGILMWCTSSWARDYPSAIFVAAGGDMIVTYNNSEPVPEKLELAISNGFRLGKNPKEAYQITIDPHSHRVLEVATVVDGGQQGWIVTPLKEDQYREVFLKTIDILEKISKEKDFKIFNLPGGPVADLQLIEEAGFGALASIFIQDLKEDPRFDIPFAVKGRGKLPSSWSVMKSGKIPAGGKNDVLIQQRGQRRNGGFQNGEIAHSFKGRNK